MDVDTPMIRRLRDALLDQAAAEVPAGQVTDAAADAVLNRIAPFLETMYLMMLVDGETDLQEQSAIRGALGFLGQGLVSEGQLDALLEQFGQRLSQSSIEGRLQSIGGYISADRDDREMAFSLAAATAIADGHVDLHESGLLETIAEWFGISSRRRRELLDAVC
jgi:uncharacterized tellurite resistance protein B-like protein